MSGSGEIHLLENEQRRGVEPDANIWLKASAGTGKTQVLSARVLRLLLAGVRPGAILGLTFTKAGAAEMAQRVRGRLAIWVQLNEQELRDQLFKIGADHLDDAVVARARTLFADVIDAPGQGLTFQTIHSFCQSLLGAFPLEAGLVPGFRAVEDRESVLLRRDLLSRLAESAVADGDGWFLDGLGRLAERMGENDALRWLDRCAGKSESLRLLPSEIGPWLRQTLDLPASDPDDWLTRWCSDSVDVVGWQDIRAEYIGWDTATGVKMAAIVGDWIAAPAAMRAADLARLLTTVYTGKGELRADFGKKLAAVADLAVRCGDAASIALTTANAMRSADRLAEALRIGRHFAAAWAQEKRSAGLVDFDDLIAHVLHLLDSDGRAEWIRYKLDQRIDHILVDEAQDTNAAQWRIVERLSEEYFAGEGARDPAFRTLFVVGDYKQAIYGFQGTDPVNFAAAEAFFKDRGDAARRPFDQLSIATNFRSAPAILQTVDAVIARQGPARLGLKGEEAFHHRASVGNEKQQGSVVLWPVEIASSASDGEDAEAHGEGWIDDATRRVADRIAHQVRRWITDGLDGEPVTAGDVLVLVRKRKELASLIVARLQAAGVPVAGVDRLRLHAPLAVQDLLAAARFAVQPLDDLNLAALLVSPLGGFDQDDLWRFGAGRGATPLWRHLREQAALKERLEPLRALLAMTDFVSPHRFFETILSGPMQGRAKLLARLGHAAHDPIDELLSQALAIGTRDGPSLHHFLAWFDSGDIEIKRESDVVSSEARVMTVHGAKGLEAPIVILADAAGNPKAGGRDTGFDWDVDGDRTIPVPGMRQEERPTTLAAAMDAKAARDDAEHWRLLYVAMTRARRRLFVTGALGTKDKGADGAPGPVADSWYSAIREAMGDLRAGSRIEPGWGQTLVHPLRAASPKSAAAAKRDPAIGEPAASLPAWISAAPGEEPRPPRPLAPSALGDEEALSVAVPPGGGGAAARRGVLIHALFERLPAVPQTARANAAARWLAMQAPDLSEGTRAEMVASALSVLDDPANAPLFGPDALGEVPFSALVDGRVIAGIADRLLVSADVVEVVDFKTGGFIPQTVAEVPEPYIKQMAAYAAALTIIFPQRIVRAALLYTGGPRMIEVPADMLAANRPGLSG